MIEHISPTQDIVVRTTGEQKKKTSLLISDEDNYVIELVIWGDIPGFRDLETEYEEGDIVMIRDVGIREYNNSRMLSSVFETFIETDFLPDIPKLNQMIKAKEKRGKDKSC